MQQVMLHGRLYTCHPKDMGQYEREWLMNLYSDIALKSIYPKNHLINLTWVDLQKDKQDFEFYTDQDDPKITKIWLSGSVDGMYFVHKFKFYDNLIQKGYTISTVGFSGEHWSSWFPYWVHKHNVNSDVTLKDIKFLYLNYNRKPHEHRYRLVQNLIQNNLLDLGYVTFQQSIFPQIDNRTGNTESDYYKRIIEIQPYFHKVYEQDLDLRFSRPEDATTLGNLDIWNSCYLNIISETTNDDPYQITEKTYKPIIGLRPFILNGHGNIYNVLQRLGFYTTKDFFNDFSICDGSVESIIRLLNNLRNLSKTELHELYLKQLPMLQSNRQRLIDICNLDHRRVLDWPQSIQ